MSAPILLDTCAALFINNGASLGREAETALREQGEIDEIWISPISAWELGLLVSRGRLALSLSPIQWFRSILDAGARLAPLTPEVLVESSFLPASPLRDPADRILAATARAQHWRLMTRDRPLLDYAAAGHLNAIAC